MHLDFFKRSNIPLKEKIDDPDEMVNDDISKKDDKDSMKGISFWIIMLMLFVAAIIGLGGYMAGQMLR